MAYAATSPIILPFTLLYFAASWIHWRYNILYISERCYESGGRCWDMTFKCIVWTLFLFELFTGDSLHLGCPSHPPPCLPSQGVCRLRALGVALDIIWVGSKQWEQKCRLSCQSHPWHHRAFATV